MKTVVLLLSLFPLLWAGSAAASRWYHAADRAWTRALDSSASGPMVLEVFCDPIALPRLLHPVLNRVRPATIFPHPLAVEVVLGWGLDLRRSDHHGHRSVWLHCRRRSGCLEPRDASDIIEQLRRNWTLQVQLRTVGGTLVHERFSLSGSAVAIDAACAASSELWLEASQ